MKSFQDASLLVKFSQGQCSHNTWLQPMIDSRVHRLNSLASIASWFLHSRYAGLASCLAAEWQYLCRIVPDIRPLLTSIQDAIRTKFL